MKTLDTTSKAVYLFGAGSADGNKDMKPLLGGKGANLAEMARIGLPVPPGFTITTDMCIRYQQDGKETSIQHMHDEVTDGVAHIESIMGTHFGDDDEPCLMSVRSGARASMPGMMDTVLNIGLNDKSVAGLSKKVSNERFAWDSYRRLIQMYGDVVMGIVQYTDDGEDPFETILEEMKDELAVAIDQDLSVDDLKELVKRYKQTIRDLTGEEFPQDPWQQLWNSIIAVFESWFTPRAVFYRQLNELPDDWGTAVNVQAMVFGNMGSGSASGVAFTRDAATGERVFNGEYLTDAQGEDVVAGIRTPLQVTKEGSLRWAALAGISESERVSHYLSLEESMPEVYRELDEIEKNLEDHYRDMQDLEFTIQEGKLWILQTRDGKRTGAAMVKIGMDLFREGKIDERELLLRMKPNKLNELLHPIFDHDALTKETAIARGLPASPGAATGQVVFTPEEAVLHAEAGRKVILTRTETSADDLKGMDAAVGILTTRGGMTSHAAVVARGMGKCCISGAGEIKIDYKQKEFRVKNLIVKEGDWISMNGSTGEVYIGKLRTRQPELSGDFEELMKISDRHARMKVRANADTPEAARLAVSFGAQGIGLCRTEHMFFQGSRIKAVREMIMAGDEQGRRKALTKLLPMQRLDFEGIFQEMDGKPVTIRLIDPPLHEFMPYESSHQEELAQEMGITAEEVRTKIRQLAETNPMLGHRGCRLGNTYPEITEMQVHAILQAAINVSEQGVKAIPEILVPLTGTVNEIRMQRKIIEAEAEHVHKKFGKKIEFTMGTMIEVPRAVLIADRLAEYSDFFSFGTNDLTQMTYGYSRDDAGKFLPIYLEEGILAHDPFQILDQRGVGELMEMGVQRARKTKPEFKVGICGEHGGEPRSVEFCHQKGLDYVSCSPYRVPIARLAAAQASVRALNE